MSEGLVKRWRKLAREWGHAAACIRERDGSTVEIADCHARADVFADCARSLEISIQRKEKRNA